MPEKLFLGTGQLVWDSKITYFCQQNKLFLPEKQLIFAGRTAFCCFVLSGRLFLSETVAAAAAGMAAATA